MMAHQNQNGIMFLLPNATHIGVDESISRILAAAFSHHPKITQMSCHKGVKRISRDVFLSCPRLRKVVMLGVEVVERNAFLNCRHVTDIECNELEMIERGAFYECVHLGGIYLPSARVVEQHAFCFCAGMRHAIFGKDLESLGARAFYGCFSMERITVPLRDRLITDTDVFEGCRNLKHVDLVDEVHDTVSALLCKDWRKDMNEEIHSINQALERIHADAPSDLHVVRVDYEKMAEAIQEWLGCVLHKIIDYKAKHRLLLPKVADKLIELELPNDVVVNHVLPYLELPLHVFDGEEPQVAAHKESGSDSREGLQEQEEDWGEQEWH